MQLPVGGFAFVRIANDEHRSEFNSTAEEKGKKVFRYVFNAEPRADYQFSPTISSDNIVPLLHATPGIVGLEADRKFRETDRKQIEGRRTQIGLGQTAGIIAESTYNEFQRRIIPLRVASSRGTGSRIREETKPKKHTR